MAQSKYNKEQKNPFSGKWEATGVAILTDEDAETLNNESIVRSSNIRYAKAKKTATKK